MGHSATSLIAWPVRSQACQRTKRSCLTTSAQRRRAARFSLCGPSRRAHGPIAWHQTIRKRGPRLRSGPIAWALRIARGNGVSPGHAPPPWRGGGIPPGQRRQRRGGWRPQGPGSRNRTRVSWGGPQLPCASKLNARHQARNSCQPVVQVQPVVAVMAGAPFVGVGVRGVGWFRSSRWWRSWPGLLSWGWGCGGWGGSGPAGGGGHGRGSFPAGGGAGGGVVQVQPVVAVTVAASLLWMRGSADD